MAATIQDLRFLTRTVHETHKCGRTVSLNLLPHIYSASCGRVTFPIPSAALRPFRDRGRGRNNSRSLSDDDQYFFSQLTSVSRDLNIPIDRVPSLRQLENHGRKDLVDGIRKRGYDSVQLHLDRLSDRSKGVQGDQEASGDSFPASEPWSLNDEALLAQKAALLKARLKKRDISAASQSPTPSTSFSLPSNNQQLKFDPSQPFDSSFRIEGPSASAPALNPKSSPSSPSLNPNFTAVQSRDNMPESGQKSDFGFRGSYSSHNPLLSNPNPSLQPGGDRKSQGGIVGSNSNELVEAEEIIVKLKSENEVLLRDILEKQQEMEVMSKREKQLQEEFKAETESELERIKAALESREADLSSMMKELEEAKAQFNMIRAKTTADLAYTQQLLAEKDQKLKAANNALSLLKQVKVEYWGEGKSVQLAGSFNGWTGYLDLNPDLSSAIPNSDGSIGPMLWEVDVYLYPGTYQVKFIVDGVWIVDSRREMTMGDFGQNNVIHVEADEGGADGI